jgi:hypothetical protein
MRLVFAALLILTSGRLNAEEPTKEFEIRNDRAYLGGQLVELWGIRCGNALYSTGVTERHVRAMDNMVAHGINLIGVYIQGSNGGWPNEDAGLNGFTRAGKLRPEVAMRLAWLIREADKRGMVVMVGLFSPRKDQQFDDESAVHRAIKEAGQFLTEQKLRNVFIDIMHEYDHSERADLPIFREPESPTKKAKLTEWFKQAAPGIEVGVCAYDKSEGGSIYPGMDLHLIQKEMPIPEQGFVVNVETQKQDPYENDGVFNQGQIDFVIDDCKRYLAAPNAAMMFHAAFIQGIGNFSGTAPHPEMGGFGTSSSDRGVRFYYQWVRQNVGRWQYPRHVLDQ